MVAGDHLDLKIAELAAQQHGVVSRGQLLAAGGTKARIDHRIAVRMLQPGHAGVYGVGRLGVLGRYFAAVLACGDDAVLSHKCGAALLGLRPTPSGRTDVTIRRRGARPQPDIAVHRTRSLHPTDVTVREGIPCTSLARTLVDLAAVLDADRLDRALEQSVLLNLFDGRALDAAIERSVGRPGVGTLRRLRAKLADDPPVLRSEMERRLLALIRRARLPPPIVNGRIGHNEVDFHWPAQRLVVETDGRATHATAHGFERDRRRDLELHLAGWDVVRIGWSQLTNHPHRVIALLRARVT
jgi:very-short-patch-repair endonuclease